MSSATPRNRRFVDSVIDAGSAALPYGFAISGLALGVGALVTEIPLVGTCGAVAGVTAGLLANHRAKGYRGQIVGLRDRLRQQRVQSDLTNTELRSRVSALEVAVWEVKTLTASIPVVEVKAEEAPISVAPISVAPVEVAPVEVANVEEAPVEELVEVKAEEAPVVPAPARPGLRLAAAAARITVSKTVLDAAVATTGSLSLADIAAAAEKRKAEQAA